MDKKAFIVSISEQCKQEMKNHSIFASVKIAQAILESAWGTSELAVKAKNIYGLKGTGPAGSILINTREYDQRDGWTTIKAKFKKYDDVNESIRDHTQFLIGKSRYVKVFEATSYQESCREFQNAGYATDPQYATKLIRIIEGNQLNSIDQEVMNDEEKQESHKPSAYAKEAWEWAINNKLTDGNNPQNTATREQVITMLYRFYKYLDH
jgi:flagellum-specific peptidoglycan hydrolase FlgJ